MQIFGATTGNMVVDVLLRVLEAYNLILLIRVITSWFPVNRTAGWYRALWAVTEPVLSILRKVIPPAGMIDFSPIGAFILIAILEQLVVAVAF